MKIGKNLPFSVSIWEFWVGMGQYCGGRIKVLKLPLTKL